jgi:hypothetical protein
MGHWLVVVRAHAGRGGEFCEILSHTVPVLEDHGWQLLGGYVTTLGQSDEYIDLWDVGPSMDGIESTIAACKQDPAFADWGPRLSEVVASEVTICLEPTSYSPAHYREVHRGPIVLVRSRCHYQKADQYCSAVELAMPTLRSRDVHLLGAFETKIGRLFEISHFWQMPDLASAQAATADELILPALQATRDAVTRDQLADYLIEEKPYVMRDVPFAHNR